MKERITTKFDIQDFLKTKEEVIEYLKASIEEDTPKEFLKSISNVLKSEGYAKITKKIGVTREGLYKGFSRKSKPKFETIYKTIDSLGLKFDIVSKKQKSISQPS